MKKIETNIKDKKYFEETNINFEAYDLSYEWNIVRPYPNYKKQTWYGLGGSITQSSAYNFSLLSEKKQKELLDAYFGKNGLDYHLGRISIASNDFCLHSYEYTKCKDFSDFSIEEDKKYVLPMLKEILKNKKITLVASPWSPPSWMKENKDLYYGDKLKKEYYESYVKYFNLFLKEYEKEGIDIQYLTIQNEPNASQRWESCKFTLEEQYSFLKDFLLNSLNGKTKVLVWDHNKENLVFVADKLMMSHEKIAGIAFHSYQGVHEVNLKLVHEKYPTALLFHTEGCCGFSKYEEIKWIKDAEYYLIDLISNMNSGLNGYIDWNLLLDFKGGPNHKENYCKSPIILNKEKTDFIKTPIYFYLSHISHIRPGFVIIPLDIYRPDLFGISAKDNKSIVTTLLNSNDWEIEVDYVVNEKRVHDILKPHSIVTYVEEY